MSQITELQRCEGRPLLNSIDSSPNHPTIRLLQGLGYKEGDTVSIQLLPVKNAPDDVAIKRGWKYYPKDNKGSKESKLRQDSINIDLVISGNFGVVTEHRYGKETTYKNGLAHLTQRNKEGYGVYFRPNAGGTFDSDIESCKVLFFESDDIPLEDQRDQIKQFASELGAMVSYVVKTKKSLHTYLKLDEAISPTDFRVWQERLIQRFKSDETIRNPSRLMRCPGFLHQSWDEGLQGINVELLGSKGTVFNLDKVDGLLPAWDESRWATKRLKETKTDVVRVDNRIVVTFDEDVSPWDIRNFLPYLENVNEQGRKLWITCKCPVHPKGKHDDTLHIHRLTGAIKCQKDGCNALDIRKAAQALAVAAGYKIPVKGSEKYEKWFIETFDAIDAANWLKLSSLTIKPWLTINEQYISHHNIESLGIERGHIYVVSSYKGSGKTKKTRNIAENFDNGFAYFNRIVLGGKTCPDMGFEWQNDLLTDYFYREGVNRKIGHTVESSDKYNPKQLENNGILVLDEADQIFEQFFGETNNKNDQRPVKLKRLEENINAVIAGNGIVLAMSADISDSDVEYLRELAPEGCEVRVIKNEFVPKLGTLHFHESKDPSELINQMCELMRKGIPVFLITDTKTSKKGVLPVVEMLKTRLPELALKIVQVHGDNSKDKRIVEYIANINETSIQQETILLAVSPSITSGLSIENGHFQHVFAILQGILHINTAAQALIRVRGCQNIHVWAKPLGLIWEADRSKNAEEINDYYHSNLNASRVLKAGYTTDDDGFDSPHWRKFCRNAAYRNLSSDKYRERLKGKLIKDGYDVVTVNHETRKDIIDELTSACDKIKIESALKVESVEILNDETFEDYKEMQNLTPYQLLQVEKTWLLRKYGQALINDITFDIADQTLTGYAAMFLTDDSGRYFNKLKAYERQFHTEMNTVIDEDFKAEENQIYGGMTRFIADMKWNAARKEYLDSINVKNLIATDKTYRVEDFEFLEKLKKDVKKCRRVAGFNPKKIPVARIAAHLISMFGLSFEKHHRGTHKIRVYEWTLDAKSLAHAELFCEHRKYQAEIRAKNEEVKARNKARQSEDEFSTVKTVAVTKPVVEIIESQPDLFKAKEPGQAVKVEAIETMPTNVIDIDITLAIRKLSEYQTPKNTVMYLNMVMGKGHDSVIELLSSIDSHNLKRIAKTIIENPELEAMRKYVKR